MAGYSKTPLCKKLGIKQGFRLVVKSPPRPYEQIVPDLPDEVQLSERFSRGVDMVHLFVTQRTTLQKLLGSAKSNISPAGMIWVSWPKKSSGVPSTVTEDVVREVCLPMDLVDVKVCAVDEIWSGLKLVIRKDKR